jgi:dethiobiotin synthetase
MKFSTLVYLYLDPCIFTLFYHALLTYQAIVDSGLSCVGWVANQIDTDMPRVSENIASIEQRIGEPLLGRIPFSKHCDIEAIGRSLDSWQAVN